MIPYVRPRLWISGFRVTVACIKSTPDLNGPSAGVVFSILGQIEKEVLTQIKCCDNVRSVIINIVTLYMFCKPDSCRRTVVASCCISDDRVRRTARWRKVASCCTGQVEPTFSQCCCTNSRHDESITISPLVTWLRVTVRCTCQYITSCERLTRWTHRHWTWTIWIQHTRAFCFI